MRYWCKKKRTETQLLRPIKQKLLNLSRFKIYFLINRWYFYLICLLFYSRDFSSVKYLFTKLNFRSIFDQYAGSITMHLMSQKLKFKYIWIELTFFEQLYDFKFNFNLKFWINKFITHRTKGRLSITISLAMRHL